jgi:hypothetical protein
MIQTDVRGRLAGVGRSLHRFEVEELTSVTAGRGKSPSESFATA